MIVQEAGVWAIEPVPGIALARWIDLAWGTVAAWAGIGLATETFREVRVKEVQVPLGAAALVAVTPGPVAHEVLPAWVVVGAAAAVASAVAAEVVVAADDVVVAAEVVVGNWS